MTWPRSVARSCPTGGAAGFTLLEMIIVLVVLGLLVGIVVSRGPVHSHGLDVRATVETLVRTLRQARGLAISGDRSVLVAVNGAERRISVNGTAALALPPGLVMTASAGMDALPTAKLAGIRFTPNGSSTGGRIVLADGRRRIVVGVDWLTGRVSVADAP